MQTDVQQNLPNPFLHQETQAKKILSKFRDLTSINLKWHGFLDDLYVTVGFMAPRILDIKDKTAKRSLKILMTLSSALTFVTFVPAIKKRLPLGYHMLCDMGIGILVALTPFGLKFQEKLTETQKIFYIVFGSIPIFIVALTRPKNQREKSQHRSLVLIQ